MLRKDGTKKKGALGNPHPVSKTVEAVSVRKRVFVSGTRFFNARERRNEHEERTLGQMEVRHDFVDRAEFRTRHEKKPGRSGNAR